MLVLIAEDSPEVARMLDTILELAGVETRVVTTDFKSLLAAEKWQGVDVALIDLMLPEVDGEEILTFLADHVPSVRRFVLSAVAHQRPGLDQLATLLTKPISPTTLVNALGVDHA